MGHTHKRYCDRYTLAFKLRAVKLANHPDVQAKDIAEGQGYIQSCCIAGVWSIATGRWAKKRIKELE